MTQWLYRDSEDGDGADFCACTNPLMLEVHRLRPGDCFWGAGARRQAELKQRDAREKSAGRLRYAQALNCPMECEPFDPGVNRPMTEVTEAWRTIDDDDPDRGPAIHIVHSPVLDAGGRLRWERRRRSGCLHFRAHVELPEAERPRIVVPRWVG